MQPTFRTDLTHTREEQDGVVYYRLEDPRTQASFRLYEIEFHIAQQLDGQRSLHKVAEIIKRDHDFEISDADLLKFIGQLESMNFVHWPREDDALPLGLADGPAPMGDIATMETSLQDISAPLERDTAPARRGSRDRAGARSMLVAGLTHLRQGEMAHARDYFIAAQEKEPTRANLDRVLEAMDGLEGGATGKEIAALWRHCEAWFPDVAGTLGPLHQPKRTTGVQLPAPGRQPIATRLYETVSRARQAPLWQRWLVVCATVAVLGTCGGAFYLLWNSAPSVHGRRLEAERVPVFAPQPATEKTTARDVWLAFSRGGQISELVAPGRRVSEHDVLVALAMPEPQRQALNTAHAAVLQVEMQLNAVQSTLQGLLTQRRELAAVQATAATRMQQLRPRVGGPDATTRAEMAKIRKGVARTTAQLAHVSRATRSAQANATRLRGGLAGLRQRQAALEARFGVQRRVAPFAGEVTEVRAKVGDTVRPGVQLVRLQDPSCLHLTFNVSRHTKLQMGQEVMVVAEAGPPLPGKVVAVAAGHSPAQSVTVALQDPAGGLNRLPAAAFHLIERYAEPAFRLPSRALIHGNDPHSSRVLLCIGGRASYRAVQVLSEVDGEAIIFDPEGKLASRSVVLTAQEDGSALATLKEGDAVELVAP